jgi:hypothetical protein
MTKFNYTSLQDKRIDQFEKCAGQMAILFKPKTIRLLNIENRTDESKIKKKLIQKHKIRLI